MMKDSDRAEEIRKDLGENVMWDEVTTGTKWNPEHKTDSSDNKEMWERRARAFRTMQRYVTGRNPNSGGLGIAVLDKSFDHDIFEEIYTNCLEIIISRDEEYCRGVYPLKNGSYIALISKKLTGNSLETRSHETTRGIVIQEEDFDIFCHTVLGEKSGVEFFFPEDFDRDKLTEWRLPSPRELEDMEHGTLDYWLNKLGYKKVIGFASGLKEVGRDRNMRVQLVVPMELQEAMFGAICCISHLIGERLFVLLQGECLMKTADILITDEVLYENNDEGRYCCMTLDQFCDMGLRVARGFGLSKGCTEEDLLEEDTDEEVSTEEHLRGRSLKEHVMDLLKKLSKI